MDTAITEILKTGGSLGGLIAVVLIFTNSNQKRDEITRAWMLTVVEGFKATFLEIQRESVSARTSEKEAIERNTQALIEAAKERVEATSATRELAKAIYKLNGKRE